VVAAARQQSCADRPKPELRFDVVRLRDLGDEVEDLLRLVVPAELVQRLCEEPRDRRAAASSSTVTASRASARVSGPKRISPGAAACCSRAATLTASPVASRSSVPVTTSPVLTPMRSSSVVS
jgi:hypothetical protein